MDNNFTIITVFLEQMDSFAMSNIFYNCKTNLTPTVKLNKQMLEKPYKNHPESKAPVKPRKYGITKEIEKFHPEARPKLRADIQQACGITRQTLWLWENYEEGSKEMIGADHIQQMAKIFRCPIESLLPKETVTT